MLNARISVQEKTRPYSSTSGCVCMSDFTVKQAWKHQVNPMANIQSHGSGSGAPGCVKCITARTASATTTTSIVQNGKKYGASVIHTFDFVSETLPPVARTFRFETRAPNARPHTACVSSCPST